MHLITHKQMHHVDSTVVSYKKDHNTAYSKVYPIGHAMAGCCDECVSNDKFQRAGALKTHKRKHIGDLFRCDEPGFDYASDHASERFEVRTN